MSKPNIIGLVDKSRGESSSSDSAKSGGSASGLRGGGRSGGGRSDTPGRSSSRLAGNRRVAPRKSTGRPARPPRPPRRP